MMIDEFEVYLKKAASQIDNASARTEIITELREHLLERYEQGIERGKTHDEAVAAALESFGDMGDIGAELDAIHTPKLKWKQIAIIAAIVCLFVISVYGYFYYLIILKN